MKRFLSLSLVLALMLATGTALAAAPKMAKEQVLRHNVGTEPEKLDPALSTGLPEMTVQLQAFEGLTRLSKDGKPVPGVAKSWEIKDNGTRYIFHLRTTAKWSNGASLTASDFEYAWKRLLKPATAAEYAYQAYYIKNGEAYNTKKLTDPNQVGVKALDKYTLEVKLESATPYFLSITSFQALFPVYRPAVEKYGDKWATKPETYIGNGPFKMVKWVHNNQIEFVKNPYYWDAANVKLNKLIFTLVDSEKTELTMWETGQIDSTNGAPASDIPRLKKEGKLHIGDDLGNYYYMFNTKIKPLDDARVRKALSLAIDRKLIVENVTRAEQVPALAFVPYGMPDVKSGADFRRTAGNYFKEDVAAAKKLLADAGYPDGKGFPTLNILYNTSDNHKRIAEAIQEFWKKNLGINVNLTNQEWGVYLESRDQGKFDIARAGWASDYVDAMSFVDMWVTNGGNNDTFWSNKEYDRLVDVAKSTSDPAKRIKAMHDAEKILMDEMPVMPIYFTTRPYLESTVAQGVIHTALGYVDFKSAWRAEK